MPNKVIQQIYDILKEDGSTIIARPAPKRNITQCQKDLVKLELEPLPQGYINFLKKNDGFAWNGIEFYGTCQIQSGCFVLMDIVGMNDEFNDNYELDEKVLLGREDDGYYTYNIDTQKYEVSDENPSEALEEYDTFEELFYNTVGGRLGICDELKYEQEEGKYDGEV